VPPWVEVRDRYHEFMVPRASRWDGPKFQAHNSWTTITTELMRGEEFEQRGVTTQTVHYIFPLLHAPLSPPLPALAQAPPPPLAAPDTPQPPVSLRSLEFS